MRSTCVAFRGKGPRGHGWRDSPSCCLPVALSASIAVPEWPVAARYSRVFSEPQPLSAKGPARRQLRGHPVAGPLPPVVRVSRGVRPPAWRRRCPAPAAHLPRPLLHPAVADRLALAGIAPHLGAVKGLPPQFKRPRFQRDL